jgi:hypothetical protein
MYSNACLWRCWIKWESECESSHQVRHFSLMCENSPISTPCSGAVILQFIWAVETEAFEQGLPTPTWVQKTRIRKLKIIIIRVLRVINAEFFFQIEKIKMLVGAYEYSGKWVDKGTHDLII